MPPRVCPPAAPGSAPCLFRPYQSATFLLPFGPLGFPPGPMPSVSAFPTQRPAVIPPGSMPPVSAFPPPRSAVIPWFCGNAPLEKPQFKAFVGKIAPTLHDDFILSLLQLTVSQATKKYLEYYERDVMLYLAENEHGSSRAAPDDIERESGDGEQKSIQRNMDDWDADTDAMQKIISLIKEKMKSKLPPIPVLSPSACRGREDANKRRQSALKERKRLDLQEKVENLQELEEGELPEAEMGALELQLWKDEEVAASGKPSLQSHVISSFHVCMKGESTVKDERSQHRAGYGFRRGGDEEMSTLPGLSDQQSSSAPLEKLGFGLIGSTTQTSVPSGFFEGDCYDVVEKRMRPLVPVNYFNEELQAAQGNSSTCRPKVMATAEFAECFSAYNVRVLRSEEQDGSVGHTYGSRTSERGIERHDKHGGQAVNETEKDFHDHEEDRQGTSKRRKAIHYQEVDNQGELKPGNKLLNTIAKAKGLSAYNANWEICDKYGLHERMRPCIVTMSTQFLFDDIEGMVDYFVACIREHTEAHMMMEHLEPLLGELTESFLTILWRKLIFEIRKIETGLT